MSTHPYCKALAALDDAVFAALLEGLATQRRASTPGLVALRAWRERVPDAAGDFWWLHLAVVFTEGSEAATQAEPLEDTHPRLARELWQLTTAWTQGWPVFHRTTPLTVPAQAVVAVPGTIIPPRPPAAPLPPKAAKGPDAPAAKTAPAPPAAPPAAPPPAPPEQRGLF